jgi:ribosomal protein S18 acetylase RimI-like enzyme
MGLLSKVRRVPEIYAAEGLGGVARAVADRLIDYTEFVVFLRDLQEDGPPAPCAVEFTLRRVDDALFERFREMPAPFPRHREYRTIYGMRHCYAAWVGEEIGALIWPAFQADNERVINRCRALLPDEARIANVWASPAYRGTGLIDAAFERLVSVIAKGGIRYLYVFTWVGNEAAKKLYRRRGMREVATVQHIALRFPRAGSGLYIRGRVPRDPVASGHRGGEIALPETIDR